MSHTYVQTVRRETDAAGKVRVWVELSDGSWFMTKWDTDPSDSSVEAYVNDFIANQTPPPEE